MLPRAWLDLYHNLQVFKTVYIALPSEIMSIECDKQLNYIAPEPCSV